MLFAVDLDQGSLTLFFGSTCEFFFVVLFWSLELTCKFEVAVADIFLESCALPLVRD